MCVCKGVCVCVCVYACGGLRGGSERGAERQIKGEEMKRRDLMYSLLHLECHFFVLESQSII